MKKSVVLGVAFLASFSFLMSSARADVPMRHLVFKYTYGSSSTIEVHTSGFGASSGAGTGDYTNGVSDQGTITVDVVKEEQDHGLLLMVSEQSQNTRSTKPTKCVVYGTSMAVVCDPNATVHEEEQAILRYLGANFVDPGRIDAKQHWQVDYGNGPVQDTADFTISKNDGGQMTISETRLQKEKEGARDATTNGDGTIGYDYNKGVPTSLHTIWVSREPQGMDQFRTLRTEITASLQTDSGIASH